MYNVDDFFFQTGCANTAALTAKWKTDAQIQTGDSTCSDEHLRVDILTCNGMKTASSIDDHHPFCNDIEDEHEDHDDHDDHEDEDDHADHSDSDSFLLIFGCVLGMLIAGIVACMC